mmetsp:Transcript_24387/g.44168  ORF Transcript_24387/g.44168 Transcript_24387/m.44168 type:complete len:477 (+) Transcript_24387:68-1498(+)
MAESKIKDVGLAEHGRKEITFAESQMPGLINARVEFGAAQPLKGVIIGGSLHMTVQTAVLIETLVALGAKVRWCGSHRFTTQDHAAAAVVKAGSGTIFSWAGESVDEFWWCHEQTLMVPGENGPDQLVDDGGEFCLLIHKGKEYEAKFAEDGSLPDPSSTENRDLKSILKLLEKSIQEDKTKFTRIATKCKGVSTGAMKGMALIRQLAGKGELSYPAINVCDRVMKCKFDNIYGSRHAVVAALMAADVAMIAGRVALVAGFGDVGKGSAFALKAAGARVVISEIDPICALQACMEGFQVATVEEVVKQVDIFVTASGSIKVIRLEHMMEMKDHAILANMGRPDGTEIDMKELKDCPGIEVENVKPSVDRYSFPGGRSIIMLAAGGLVNFAFASGFPSFTMSSSFTNQVLAQIDIVKRSQEEGFKNEPHLLPFELEEKVAGLLVKGLGASLTELNEEQADYIGVKVGGPFKHATYRY